MLLWDLQLTDDVAESLLCSPLSLCLIYRLSPPSFRIASQRSARDFCRPFTDLDSFRAQLLTMEEKKVEAVDPSASDVEGHVEVPYHSREVEEDPDPGATEEERKEIV